MLGAMIPSHERPRLDTLIAFVASLPEREKRTKQQWDELRGRVVATMEAAGFAFDPAGDERKILSARELDGAQRAVAEILARHPEVPIHAFPLPGPAWAKRRWLGLDPPGPLFEGEPTLYARIRATDDEDAVEKLLRALPRDRRIEVLADLLMLGSDYDDSVELVDLLRCELREIPTTMGAWGRRMAALLLSFVGTPWESHEAQFGVRPEVFNAVLHALVRGGVPIEPASEALLALENYPHEHETLRACIAAIPAPRREAAVVAALARVPGHASPLRVAWQLLEHFEYPSIARFVLAHADDGNAKAVVKQLAALAKRAPAIAEVLAAWQKDQAPVPTLKVLERTKPTIDELDARAREQVEISAHRFDGRERTAALLLSGDDEEDLGPYERVRIADEKGKLAYDAWLHGIDAGTIFGAGTTDVVAEIVQDGLECADRALRRALIAALAETPKAAKKPNTSKAPAKKAKAPAKKAKAPAKKR
jgi:hypothetical protein